MWPVQSTYEERYSFKRFSRKSDFAGERGIDGKIKQTVCQCADVIKMVMYLRFARKEDPFSTGTLIYEVQYV